MGEQQEIETLINEEVLLLARAIKLYPNQPNYGDIGRAYTRIREE